MTLTIILAINSNAQTFESNFLGEDYLLYKGVLFKLKDNADPGYFSYTFYSDLKYFQSDYEDINVIYPEKEYHFNTIKDSLANRIFIVEDIVDKNGGAYTGSSFLYGPPIFILKDTTTKQKIYYKYDSKDESKFQFNTSKIVLDEKIYSKMVRNVDDFTDVIELYPYYGTSSMNIHKYIRKTGTFYYLWLDTHGSTVVVDGTGVIILFTDGTKWTNPEKIDVEADSKGFEYHAFITLTQADLITFSTKKIKKIRLYIFDEEVNSFDADKFKIFAKCIREAK